MPSTHAKAGASALASVRSRAPVPAPRARARAVEGVLERGPSAEDVPGGGAWEMLSARELQVLRELVTGKNNAQIAKELFISPETVKKHVSSILAKTGMENRVQAAVQAVRSGLV